MVRPVDPFQAVHAQSNKPNSIIRIPFQTGFHPIWPIIYF